MPTDAVVICGVTPLAMEILGEMAPDQSILPVPDSAVPMEQKVAVAEPPVQAGKLMTAVGLH